MTAELIVDGRVETRRRARRRLRHPRRVLAALLLVAAALLLLDRWLQQREFAQLAARAATAQQSIDFANAQVNGAIQYGSPQLFLERTPSGVQTYLRGLVTDASVKGAVDVATAEVAVSGVSILPWHRALVDARTEFVQHAQGWQEFLRTGLQARFGAGDWTARLTSGRASAEAALLAAVPYGSDGSLPTGIRSMFAKSP